MHLKQKDSYGCGVYSIANATQNGSFITNKKIKLSKNGNNIGQLNRWLLKFEIKCWISEICYNNGNIIKMFDLSPQLPLQNDKCWMPFLIVTKGIKKDHMIGCRYLSNGKIIVHDSTKDHQTEYLDFDEFNSVYADVVISFEMLCDYTNNRPIYLFNQ